MLFGLDARARRLFSLQELGPPMSVGRLLPKLGCESGIRLAPLFGGQSQVGGIDRELNLVWEACRSQIQGLHSLYIRSFSIIGGPLP